MIHLYKHFCQKKSSLQLEALCGHLSCCISARLLGWCHDIVIMAQAIGTLCNNLLSAKFSNRRTSFFSDLIPRIGYLRQIKRNICLASLQLWLHPMIFTTWYTDDMYQNKSKYFFNKTLNQRGLTRIYNTYCNFSSLW